MFPTIRFSLIARCFRFFVFLQLADWLPEWGRVACDNDQLGLAVTQSLQGLLVAQHVLACRETEEHIYQIFLQTRTTMSLTPARALNFKWERSGGAEEGGRLFLLTEDLGLTPPHLSWNTVLIDGKWV